MTVSEQLVKVAENREKLYEAGKKAEYDAFCREFFKDGNWQYRFAGIGWNDKTFRPPNDIVLRPATAAYLFRLCRITDLKAILELRNATIDFSTCNTFVEAFCYSTITHIPVIDATYGNTSPFSNCFAYAEKLEQIDKIILKNDGSQGFNNTFIGCPALEEIRFDGVIGKSISFTDCKKLSYDSFADIFDHLSRTSTGQTATFSATAKEAAGIPDDIWNNTVNNLKNWTISLV